MYKMSAVEVKVTKIFTHKPANNREAANINEQQATMTAAVATYKNKNDSAIHSC